MPSPTPTPATDPRRRFFDAARAALSAGTVTKLILAGPRDANADLQRVQARPLLLKGRPCLSLNHLHRTKDVTRNLPVDEGLAALEALLGSDFDNAHLLTRDGGELQLAISRKGKASLRQGRTPVPLPEADAPLATTPAPHDRRKHRPVDITAPWLTALGVTDASQRLVPAMARKWKQINKFVEVLDHALDAASGLTASVDADRPLQVLDFGAGKGYLSFAVHDHLRHRGLPARVTGVDLKEDMVALGNRSARELGLGGLDFELGDVRSYATRPVDVMIALHACDIATDHAMHMGIRAGARIIMCAPCCHKELRPQMRSPLLLLPLLRHGIHLGQEAEMLTDGLRALLLEAEGYDTQVFEFTALEHTSKNKMVLAVKREHGAARPPAELRAQVREIKAYYGVAEQRLERLLDGPVEASPGA